MREMITTWLEVVGLVAVDVAAGVEVATFSVAGGIGLTGVLLLVSSLVIERTSEPARRRKGDTTA